MKILLSLHLKYHQNSRAISGAAGTNEISQSRDVPPHPDCNISNSGHKVRITFILL